MFIGRERELNFFNSKYEKKAGQLIVLYGRRRIGKTELLRTFAKDRKHVFYSSVESTDLEQLEGFSKRLLKFYKESDYLKSFQSWQEAFDYFMNSKVGGKKLLIIDEFPYMVKSNRAIPSILENMWDESLRHEDIMIVLCGSSMSFIENEILAEKNPLYGRTTGIYKMNQMTFQEAIGFYPDYSFEMKIAAYGILGGIPHYLKQFDDRLTIRENVIENILTKGSTLYSEVEFLMRQELRETHVYNTLISVIAMGNTKLNEIHQKTQIEKAKIGVYLKNLIDLGIVEREFPVTERIKATVNVQRGLYRITDNYFKFWYKFLFPNISELEEDDADTVYDSYIEPYINEHISFAFEEVCIQYLKKRNKNNDLPFKFSKIGRWWNKQSEIDIMALGLEDRHILGECKWRREKVGSKVLSSLEGKARAIDIDSPVFILFSKSGFTEDLKYQVSNREDVELVDLKKIELVFSE